MQIKNILLPIIFVILFCTSFILESQKKYSTSYYDGNELVIVKNVEKEQYKNIIESIKGKYYYPKAIFNTKVLYPFNSNSAVILLLKYISLSGIFVWLLLYKFKQ